MDSAAEAEFSEFVHGRWSDLVRLAYGITGERLLAENLAKTALANAYASWPRVRRAGDPDAYLRRIVLKSNRNDLRRQLASVGRHVGPPISASANPRGHDGGRSPVRSVFQALPLGQREVIVLHYWLGLDLAQVAATLGCPVGNVKRRLSSAATRIRMNTDLAQGGMP